MAGAWGCPHEANDTCTRVNNLPCDPGMKGCILYGRYIFFGDDAKNKRLRQKREQSEGAEEREPDEKAGT